MKPRKPLSNEWPEATREFRGSFPKEGAKPKKDTRLNAALRERVLRRDGNRCVAKALIPEISCLGTLQVHHVWRRSQGGPDEEDNLKSVCASHHEWIHRNVQKAKALDLIRKPPASPVA